MDCRPSDLQDLAYGFLDDGEARRVRAHAARCSRCAADLGRLVAEQGLLAQAAGRADLSQRRGRLAGLLLPLSFAAALLVGLVWTMSPPAPERVAFVPASQEKKSDAPPPLDEAGLRKEIDRLQQALDGTKEKQERNRIQAAIDNLKVELARATDGKPVKKDEMVQKPLKKGPTRYDELTKALEKTPDDPALLIARAEECLKTKRAEEGARDARKAVMLAPENARAHWVLGQACRTLKQNEEADQALARAIQLDPKLAGEVKQFKQTSKAQQELDQVYAKMKMTKDPEERARLEMRAKELNQDLKLLSQGESMINIKEVELRLQQDPNDVPALVDRAAWNLESAKAAPALKDLDRAIELKPDYSPAYHKRAVAHAWLGDTARAVADAKKAEQLDPNNRKAVENTLGTIKKLNQAAKDKQRAPADRTFEINALKDRLDELRAMAANAELPATERERAAREADRVAAEIEKLKTDRPAEKQVEKKK